MEAMSPTDWGGGEGWRSEGRDLLLKGAAALPADIYSSYSIVYLQKYSKPSAGCWTGLQQNNAQSHC